MNPPAADATWRHTPIGDLIPHRAPMSLIDQVLDADSQGLRALVQVHNVMPFWHDLGVPSYIGLEYLGQGCAAFFSTHFRQQTTTASVPRAGMLIASRRYDTLAHRFPTSGWLLISVSLASPMQNIEAGQAGMVKFSGRIQHLTDLDQVDSDLILIEFASGDLSVYLPPS